MAGCRAKDEMTQNGIKGFFVTFVQVDPLFTLDFSDPENPFVAGELKVPGYFTYIHLIGENILLSIGKDVAIENGSTWNQGLQMSLFNIIYVYPVLQA
jgi:uncharacterized secreted protein with C-terminal beta-propeller domain